MPSASAALFVRDWPNKHSKTKKKIDLIMMRYKQKNSSFSLILKVTKSLEWQYSLLQVLLLTPADRSHCSHQVPQFRQGRLIALLLRKVVQKFPWQRPGQSWLKRNCKEVSWQFMLCTTLWQKRSKECPIVRHKVSSVVVKCCTAQPSFSPICDQC